jgi:hypothetical protein
MQYNLKKTEKFTKYAVINNVKSFIWRALQIRLQTFVSLYNSIQMLREICMFMKFRDFWDILPCSQITVDIDLTTRQYIPENSELRTRRHENLKFGCIFMFAARL